MPMREEDDLRWTMNCFQLSCYLEAEAERQAIHQGLKSLLENRG